MFRAGGGDVARSLAAGAPDLQPRKATVDGLVDGRRRIDRLAGAPKSLVPTLAQQAVGPLQHGLGPGSHLRRTRREDVCHRTRFAEFLVQSLPVASRERRAMMFLRHPDILESGRK